MQQRMTLDSLKVVRKQNTLNHKVHCVCSFQTKRGGILDTVVDS